MQEVKGESSGSTKFITGKLKAIQGKIRDRKLKRKREAEERANAGGDGNLESAGKKFTSNGSLVSQANGVRQNIKGEPAPVMSAIYVMSSNIPPSMSSELQHSKCCPLNTVESKLTPPLSSQQKIPSLTVKVKSASSSPSTQPTKFQTTSNSFTLEDTCTTKTQDSYHADLIDRRQEIYLQPQTRGVDEFLVGHEKAISTITNFKTQGKPLCC